MTNDTHLHRRAGWLALVAAGVLLLGACGGGDGDDPAPEPAADSASTTADADADAADADEAPEASSGDFCRLITKAEADALAGKDLGEGTASKAESPVGDVGSCVYKLIEGGRVTSIVNLTITGTEVSRELYDAELAGDTPVSGVGDVATLIQPGILSVLDGGVALTVQVLVDLAPASTEQLVEVARKALDRF